jgi:thymidylate kinase
MYVGFAGVGGSGKSTIASAVAKQLSARGYRVAYYSPFFKPGAGILYKIGWSLYLWRWFDRELVRFFVVETTSRTWTKKIWWRVYMALMLSYYLDRVQNKYDVLIYDEDMIKWQAMPVADGTLEKNRVTKIYQEKVLAGADAGLLVMVDTLPAEAARRFLQRGDGSGRSAAVLEAETRKWDTWQTASRELLQHVTAETALHRLTVDGEQTVAHNTSVVMRKLEAIGLPGGNIVV